jgi:hypothetical protein
VSEKRKLAARDAVTTKNKPLHGMAIRTLLVLLSLGVDYAYTQDRTTGEPPQRGSLRWYAAQAKADGRRHVEIPGPQGLYAQVESLKEALSVYSVVVAKPVASRIYAQPDRIVTWYKFQIVEQLYLQPEPDEIVRAFPTEFQPLGAGQFLMQVAGGKALVDGVEIEVKSPLSNLSVDNKYVLFLLFDRSGKVATLQLGPAGVLVIKADQTIETVTEQPTKIRKQIDELQLHRLDRFRREVQLRPRN